MTYFSLDLAKVGAYCVKYVYGLGKILDRIIIVMIRYCDT